MAFLNRLKTANMTLCTVSSAMVDKLRGIEHTESPTRIDATCIKDTYRGELPGITAKQYSLTQAIETTGAYRALVGTNVAYTIDLAGTEEIGSGYLFDLGESGPLDGLQEERIVLSVHTVTS